jgi:2',3'-cyclic-nucleotide 2'-phosphodiesterase (5'-nucleotidase family)
VHRRSALGGDSALGDLTADVMLSMTAADAVVLNSSGLRADLEAGALLRSDLELAFPFDEPWRLVWLTGSALRRGLEQGARRSATRDCESAVQVAGLRLQIRCGACRAGGSDCLRVERPTPLGPAPVGDDQSLLVVLPTYLALPGADFEVVGTTGSEVDAVIEELFARYLGTLPRLKQLAPCRESLGASSPSRCREGFGAEGCPLNEARAQAVCRALPNVEAARDGRIEMLP